MARRRNSDADFLEGKLEHIYAKTIDVYGKMVDKILKGEIEPTGNNLNALLAFMRDNEMTLQGIRQRQAVQAATEDYSEFANMTFPEDEEEEEDQPERPVPTKKVSEEYLRIIEEFEKEQEERNDYPYK